VAEENSWPICVLPAGFWTKFGVEDDIVALKVHKRQQGNQTSSLR
jgi:hypothetical protein